MFPEMRNVLEEDYLVIECDVIEQNKMLMQLPHVPNVRNDRQAILVCHQADGDELANACQPCAIGLNKMHASVVEEGFEQDAIGNVLARGNLYRTDFLCQRGVRAHVVWMCRFFYPEWVEFGEFAAHPAGI